MTVWRNQNTRPISICNSYRYTLLFSMYACRWKDVHGKFPTSDDVDALFRDFVPMQLACLRQYSELLPGCADAIKRMKEDLKLKIGSSTGTVHTEIGACSKQYRCISNVHSKMPHHQLYWNDTTYSKNSVYDHLPQRPTPHYDRFF